MKLTPRATQALEHAHQLARGLGHANVDSQHLVFGLFQLGSGVSFRLLRSLGFTSDSLWQAIAAKTPAGSASSASLIFDASANQALERAGSEAAGICHNHTGTEHILLALLAEEQGGAARLFASHGVDPAATRQTILQEMQAAS